VWKLVSVGNPTIRKKWLEFISQHKKNNAFAIFNQFIVSALTHCVSTTLIGYSLLQASDSRSCPTPRAVQLNSIFSAKTDPRENPGKNPGIVIESFIFTAHYPCSKKVPSKNGGVRKAN
jgi:hypothetical protein